MILQEFDEALLEAIDFTFYSLGRSCRRALYFHLKTTFHLPRRQIPKKVEEFDEALRMIFKIGAVFLEKLILAKLCEMLKLELVEGGAVDFVESISMIRGFYLSNVVLISDSSEITSTAKRTRR
jgi:hypothetical protein